MNELSKLRLQFESWGIQQVQRIIPFINFILIIANIKQERWNMQQSWIRFIWIKFSQLIYKIQYSIHRMIQRKIIQQDQDFIPNTPFITIQSSNNQKQTQKQQSSIHKLDGSKYSLKFKNIFFEENTKKLGKQLRGEKSTKKRPLKKLGKAKLILLNQQKRKLNTEQKENAYQNIKQKIQISSRMVLKSRRNKSECCEQFSERYLQLDEQLKILHKKRLTNKIEKMNINQTEKYIQKQFKVVPNAVSSVPEFQTINRYVQPEYIGQRGFTEQTKPENGFYRKLKQKISNEMEKIYNKITPSKQKPINQGCKVQKANKKMQHYRSLTERSTPRASLSRTGFEFKFRQIYLSERKVRTARSSRKQVQYLCSRPSQLLNDQYQEPRQAKTFKSSSRKTSGYIPAFNKTVNYVSPFNKKSVSKKQLKKQNIKEKMLGLLVKADKQTDQLTCLKSGFKVFKSYTNRMKNRLSQASKQLQGIQNKSFQQFYD